ncbi:MAG: iron ABC transporter substrate-binding protein [Acidimicrobiales bacterium]|nr:iron ABC transporter substrate-binding protein [Acidimicrobiales bacterium]
MRRLLTLFTLLLSLTLFAAACGDDDDSGSGDEGDAAGERTLELYSGRSEELVGPLIEQFEEASGIDVTVTYGDTAEVAAKILEEGDNSPADVFFGQDAGALGALAKEDRLARLSDAQLDLVDPALRDDQGDWVGVSARSRAVVYNTDKLTEADLPASILDFTDPAWSGRLGWAPTNGSFQAFVTALRVLEGEDGARAWLEGIKANSPKVFDNNVAIVEAVAAGEIDAGFVNHYYLYQYTAEDPDFAAANKIYGGGDPGGLVNVAGVGILTTADHVDEANELVDFLLSAEAQEYFATETFEIPVAGDAVPAEGVPTIESLTLPDIDLNQLDDLAGTLALLTELGIV